MQAILKARKQKTMSRDDISKISSLLQEYKIESLAYFNLGEPFFSKNIKDELSIIRQHNPDIKIFLSTNGVLLDSQEKMEAALLLDEILISVDGSSQNSVNKYQVNYDFNRAYQNIKHLVALRNERGLTKPQIEWKYVLFNWNDSPKIINNAIELAHEAKVDLISFWPTITPPYGISWRYKMGRYNNIGTASWKGREVWINK